MDGLPECKSVGRPPIPPSRQEEEEEQLEEGTNTQLLSEESSCGGSGDEQAVELIQENGDESSSKLDPAASSKSAPDAHAAMTPPCPPSCDETTCTNVYSCSGSAAHLLVRRKRAFITTRTAALSCLLLFCGLVAILSPKAPSPVVPSSRPRDTTNYSNRQDSSVSFSVEDD